MKFIDKLKNVDKSKESYPRDYEFFSQIIHVDYDYNIEKFYEKVKAYWVESWVCTDTSVGTEAIYIDDELVGYTTQSARKNTYHIYFINEEAQEKTRKVLKECVIEEDINMVANIDILNAEEGTYDQYRNIILGEIL